ncbi:class I SAM-dependent methyltransferase [Methanoplanus endosymbiosus]|uniref:Class I SAM-dependent methyltransferase n=1 Tax=Methanoplanus endosymbiosus TaxID=33865 RepID=A0A9E7PLY6_9EURY|nr:class I SAM-dependent methyltransferase [Methanoplanus endosymbiosus]UUX91389.1 class I SAM-dependent methyltransferase [Methanoplanus endosymbiosus]
MRDSAEEEKIRDEEDFVKVRKKVLDLAGVNNLEILDIGAGPLSAIAAKYYSCSVTSVDIDRKELRLWKEYAEKEGVSDRISFEEEDAADLYYCDDAFDVCISFCALHHFPIKIRDQALSEFRRVSSKRFIIVEYTEEGFSEVHSREDFEPVNLKKLEENLKETGITRVIPVDKMMVYVVDKKAQ